MSGGSQLLITLAQGNMALSLASIGTHMHVTHACVYMHTHTHTSNKYSKHNLFKGKEKIHYVEINKQAMPQRTCPGSIYCKGRVCGKPTAHMSEAS